MFDWPSGFTARIRLALQTSGRTGCRLARDLPSLVKSEPYWVDNCHLLTLILPKGREWVAICHVADQQILGF